MVSAITASVVPSTSVLTAGQSLSETLNWPVFLDLSNYATSAAGASIASVVVDYAGSTSGAAEPLTVISPAQMKCTSLSKAATALRDTAAFGHGGACAVDPGHRVCSGRQDRPPAQAQGAGDRTALSILTCG